MTQSEKIKAMCAAGNFVCQISFWNMPCRSPHKRRSEIEAERDSDGNLKYRWETRPCIHGQSASFDYKLVGLGKREPLVEKIDDYFLRDGGFSISSKDSLGLYFKQKEELTDKVWKL